MIGNTLGIFSPPALPAAIAGPRSTRRTRRTNGDLPGRSRHRGSTQRRGSDLTAKRITKTRRVKHRGYTDILYTYSVRFSGYVQAGGQPAGGANYERLRRSREQKVGEATTNDNGSFTRTMRLKRTGAYHAILRQGGVRRPAGAASRRSRSAPSTCRAQASPRRLLLHHAGSTRRQAQADAQARQEEEAQVSPANRRDSYLFDGAPTGAPSSIGAQC